MALFDTNTDPAARAANQLRAMASNQYRQLTQTVQNGWSGLWQNREATPEQILAALGKDAAAILALADLNAQTLKSAARIGASGPRAGEAGRGCLTRAINVAKVVSARNGARPTSASYMTHPRE